MVNHDRSGEGYWYYGNDESITKVFCKWENDIPDGAATIETFINPEKIARESGHIYAIYTKEQGILKAGVYIGEWNIFWDMEAEGTCDHEWNVIYDAGMMQTLDGKMRHIVLSVPLTL